MLHKFSGLVPSNGKLVGIKGYNEKGEKVPLTDLAYKYDENGNKTDEVEDFFWKVLTDRSMFGNQGQYLPQRLSIFSVLIPIRGKVIRKLCCEEGTRRLPR